MDISAIATASIYMNMAQAQQSVDIAMLKKSMDLQQETSNAIIEGMKSSVPSFGHKLDVRV